MIGLEKETICMDLKEAAQYVLSKITLLEYKKEQILSELNAIEEELDSEYDKLSFLNDAPSMRQLR